MSNKKEKETGRAKNIGSEGLGLNSNTDAGIGGRLARLVRSSDTTAKKCSADRSKRPEESSVVAKKTAKGVVSENQPRKLKTVSDIVSKPRASAVVLQETVTKSVSEYSKTASVSSKPASVSSAVKHNAAKVAQKETGGQKEKDQVARTPRVGKQPDSPANKTATETTTPQQVWKVKAQPESSAKEISAKKQQAQPSGSTSKQSTKTTKSGPPPDSSKVRKSATQKKDLEKDCLPEGQSSQDKQVQGKQANHKASTSKSYLDTEIYPEYHIELNVADFEELDYQIGVCCCLCEQDLGVAPVEGHTEYEYSALPVAAILPCGHTFHNDCLCFGELEGQQAEPPCVFCESL